jgi:glycosyltransferase involved in cell wall biosynthesis
MKLVYANDCKSVYDKLFLEWFTKDNDVSIVTFNTNPTALTGQEREVIILKDVIPETNLHPFEGARKELLSPMRARTFKKAIKNIKPDVVIGNFAPTYGYYSAYSNFNPNVLFIWGSDVLVYPFKYKFLNFLIKYAIAKADVILVDSNVQLNATLRLGADKCKIVKFPWFDSRGFSCDKDKRKMLRERFGLSEDDILAVSARNNKPVYDLKTLVKVIPRIAKKYGNAHFVFFGEGTEAFSSLGLPNTTCLGKVKHDMVNDVFSASDIYVSTSLSDGASASLLEAMCCKLAPIVTRILGNEEWINDSFNGLLFNKSDFVKLYECLDILIADKPMRESMAKLAYETAKKIDWETNMNTLCKAIKGRIGKVN